MSLDTGKPDERALWEAVLRGEKPRQAGRDLGIPHRRVWYLCAKWSRLGIYEWGVTIDLGWPTREPRRPRRRRPHWAAQR